MKTSSSKVARRYAKALVNLCDERGDGEAVRAALGRLEQVLDAAPESLAFLANPTMALESRKAVLKSLLDGAQIDGSARNLVSLLLDKGRIGELRHIAAAFAAMLDERTGRVQAEVVSAVALQDATVQRLRALLQKMLSREIVLHARVDADLIGGLVVHVGNTVYDASILNHLNRLRHRMVEQA